MPCKHLLANVTLNNTNQIAASQWNYSTRPGGAPCLSLCPFYWTSAGLKTRETSCPRIDDSVSNIPIPWPCLWPLVCPVGLWHQTSHHMLLPQCSRLVWSNHHFVTTNPIISSQPNSLRTSSGWSGDNPRIVIICIKRRKDQHENRKHPWDKVLRVVRRTDCLVANFSSHFFPQYI